MIRQEKNQQFCQVDYPKPECGVHLENPEYSAADLLHPPPKDRTAQHGQFSGECRFCFRAFIAFTIESAPPSHLVSS